MIHLNAVSYLNTKPFIFGLENTFKPNEINIKLLIPSLCAVDFASGSTHLSLLPVGSLLDFESVTLLDEYCIGADGFVDSVYLYAQQPIESIRNVYLDWHSRTSNGLTQILFKNYWKQDVTYKQEEDYFKQIEGTSAGVIIGDRAIAAKNAFKYRYDLASAWKEYTGLPFAFAVWAYRSNTLAAPTLEKINEAFKLGIENKEYVAEMYGPKFGLSKEAAYQYLSQSIDYNFDTLKHEALNLYLKELALLHHVNTPAVSIL